MSECTKDNKTADDLREGLDVLVKVDLYDGINKLRQYTQLGDAQVKDDAYKKSGIEYISRLAKHYLVESKIAKNIMVEYSLLSSTLDPAYPNELQCCSFALGDNDFRESIDKEYSDCIAKTVDKKGLSLYQHRYFLYDLTINPQRKPKYNKFEGDIEIDDGTETIVRQNGECLTITIKQGGKKKGETYSISHRRDEAPNEHFREYKEGLSIAAIPLKRSYSKMVTDARTFEEKKGNRVVDIQNCLHSFCHQNITVNRKHSNKKSVYFSFAIFSSEASNILPQYKIKDGVIQGVGACFVYFELDDTFSPSNDAKRDNMINRIEGFVSDMSAFMRFISINYVFNLGLQLQENARKESIKSAISAIMSRNMSHNLGSHYLYYTKTYLEDLASVSGKIGPDIRGAAKVLGYMQARMDYLATIISNDRYPNGAVNFKSQIYDELTVDDFSKRHFEKYKDRNKRTTNFLLSNLVMSENFTRSNIMVKSMDLGEDKVGEHFHSIKLQVKLWNGHEYVPFTGSSFLRKIEKEKDVKNELSKLNIALPGGTMSCHAFFNVIENFIRNSAKYLQEDFKPEGLVFTIAIRKSKEDECLYDFVIYDNKNNAQKVLPVLFEQLGGLKILDEEGKIEKSSKGLKEMLFSSVWMRTYKYPEMSFADVINLIQNENNAEKKVGLIENYGFSFVAVSDSGEVVDEQSHHGNLGLRLMLPEFCISSNFEARNEDSEKEIISRSLKIASDIVCVNKDVEEAVDNKNIFNKYFTRPYYERDFNEKEFTAFFESSRVLEDDKEAAKLVYRFKSILDKRFDKETEGDIDKMCLFLGDRRDMKRLPEKHSRIIYFERHLNTKKGFDAYMDYAYVDSISGGNFTITLNSLMDEGITEDTCRYRTWNDKLYGLKIKESALTRITLIDERLFNNMSGDGPKKELEYSLKNIRVLNVNLSQKYEETQSLADLFVGNTFIGGGNRTHFLSIHLGLIEKIVKSEWGMRKYGKTLTLEKRVSNFMDDMTAVFSGKDCPVFISVHSGRGNFSKELEGPLATYPFVSLSAIENAFGNSKYLLSQLFYNTVYIGKGIINQYK